ncbi:MAG: glycosyltransferase [Leptolyngbyaceae cyanobacterium bins.302]|nr:glycosyltransferase [Leptolyngbyaceae cyanobacterium bins.302]
MKTLALVDTFWHGHHPLYFRLFTKVLLKLGYKVAAFCQQTTEINEWIEQQLPNAKANLSLFLIQEGPPSKFPIGRIRRAQMTLARWETVAQTLRDCLRHAPDLVLFPCIEPYLSPYLLYRQVDQRFPYDWAGLYCGSTYLRVRQPMAFARRGWLDPDEVLKSSHCRALAVQDEQTIPLLQNKLGFKPIIVFPNAAENIAPDYDYPSLAQIQAKARGRKIIGLLGSQGKRKGVLTLLEVAQQSVQEDWFFLFAGEFGANSFSADELQKIEAIVQSQPDNCFFQFGRIPGDSQFHALVEICDILFVVYEQYPSTSQMLTLAAMFEKPVVANNTYWVGEKVRQFNLGVCVPEADISQCQEAIRQLCNPSYSIEHWLQPNFRAYRDLHSTKQLQVACQELLNAAFT